MSHDSAHTLRSGKYDLDFKNPDSDKSKWLTGKELADVYIGMIKKYGIISIEDPFDQDDWEAWVHFTNAAGIQVVGDDLTVTNVERIKTAIEKTACNSTSVLSVLVNADSVVQVCCSRSTRSVPLPSQSTRKPSFSTSQEWPLIVFLSRV